MTRAKIIFLEILLFSILSFFVFSSISFAQTQSHPVSQITPADTNLNLSTFNISTVAFINYSRGLLINGTQGIPSADIGSSAVTGSKIASGVVTASKLSDPLGGYVNGTIYYDSDNPSYYLDAASTGISLLTAGNVSIGTTTSARGRLDVRGTKSDTQGVGTIVLGDSSDAYWAFRLSNTGSAGGLDLHIDRSFGAGAFSGLTPPFTIRRDTGNVGIGTTSPGRKIEVADGTLASIRLNRTGQRAYDFLVGTGTGQDFEIFDATAGLTRLFIRNDGNIGINTTTPQNTLNVIGDLNVTGTIYGGINISAASDLNCTGCVGTADIADNAVTGAKIASGVVTSTKLSNPLGGAVNATIFYDSDNSNYYADFASTGTSLTTAGSVGIGTTSPVNKLNVIGDINATTNIYMGISGWLNASGEATGTAQAGIKLRDLSSGDMTIAPGNAGGVQNNLIIPIGKVGIGTLTPGYKLHVSQTGAGSGLLVQNSGGAAMSSGPLVKFNTTNAADIGGTLLVVGNANGAGVLEVQNDGSRNLGSTEYVTQIKSVNAGDAGTVLKLTTTGTSNAITVNTNQFVINGSSGKVGIGTTSPNNILHVVTSDNGGGIYVDGAVDNVELILNTSGVGGRQYSWDSTSGTSGFGQGKIVLRDRTAGAARLAVDSSGKIGINTTSPQKTVDIVGDLNVTGTIYGALNTTGDVNCTGCVDTADIANNAVTGAKIASGAVTSSDLSNPLGGAVNATIYYDSDNSAYFADLASTGNSLLVAGNVGIGTTSPSAKLDVKGSTSGIVALFQENDLYTQIRLNNSGTGGNTWSWLAGNGVSSSSIVPSGGIGFRQETGTVATRMVIDSSGNVGIGTTSPNKILEVRGSIPVIRINATQTGHADAEIQFGNNTATYWGIGLDTRQTGSTNFGISSIQDSANRLTITTSGNVGIGTSSPGSPLDVVTTVNTDGIQISGTTDNNALRLFSSAAGGRNYYIASTGGTSGWGQGRLAFVDSSVSAARMVIDSSGNVGINTTSPNATLEVNGGLRLNSTGSRPSCGEGYRGGLWFEKASGSTDDFLYSCMKNSTNFYNWVLVARGS